MKMFRFAFPLTHYQGKVFFRWNIHEKCNKIPDNRVKYDLLFCEVCCTLLMSEIIGFSCV